MFGGKLTLQLTDKDQFIGYSQWSLKEKPNRGLSNTVPPESILAQASTWGFKDTFLAIALMALVAAVPALLLGNLGRRGAGTGRRAARG